MYDLPLRTTPLASNESVLVSFDTVEDQPTGAALEHYDISIFGDSHIQVLVFGQPEAAGNIVGAVGFHPSPNSPLPHVVAELQVPLVPGGATVYSPDPNFWSSTIPPTPPPDPCPTEPGKTLNKCEKQLDRAVGLGSGVLALGV